MAQQNDPVTAGRTFTVELGFDINGIRNPLQNRFYLPNDVSADGALATHCGFRVGDKVGFRIFDISSVQVGDVGVTPVSFQAIFNEARGQEHTSPFPRAFLLHDFRSLGSEQSVVFEDRCSTEGCPTWDAARDGETQFLIEREGFFFTSYTLGVQIGGNLTYFQSDPEWIVGTEGI
ncbi:MAG: hypothetical protein AAF657_39720 [Acidobacteriota bacterium]